MKKIESVHNPLIKSLVQLQEKAKARKQLGTFLIEGKRELELAVSGNYEIETILFCHDFLDKSFNLSIFQSNEIIEISKEVYQKLAYRDTTEGVIAVAKTKSVQLYDLKLPDNPLVVVLESLEKPGNIGAILRTCDAAKIDAILIANPKTDLYNPNLVRSSVGCLFTNQIAVGENQDIIDFLLSRKINIYSATLQNSNVYYKENYTQGTAIVVGTEATGLTEIWRKNAKQNIVIPMLGAIDSMNVSVSAAILIYEAKRQRGFE